MGSWEFCSYTWQKDGPGGFAVLSPVGQTNMGISRKPLQNHWLWNAHCKLLCVFLYCRLHCSRQSCCWAEKLVDKLEQPHLQVLSIYAVCTLVVCLNLHSASFCFSNCVTESPSVFLYHFLHFQFGPKPVCHIFLFYLNLCNCLGFFCEFQAICFGILGHKWLKRCRISSSFKTQANLDLFFSSPQQRIKVIMFSCNNQCRIKHLIFLLFLWFSSRMSKLFFLNFHFQCCSVTVCISVCVCISK